MTKQRGTRIWVVPGTLALLLLAAGNAWTQDVFASNGGASDSGSSTPAVYQDSFSNSCDKSSNSSLNVDGYNPAICEKVTIVSGQECLSNSAETGYALVKQQGNVCYYCEQPVPPAKYRVIVPEDLATAVYQQAKGALYCGRTAADPCYWECYGNVPPVVPTAGVTPMPPDEYGVTGTPPEQTAAQPAPPPPMMQQLSPKSGVQPNCPSASTTTRLWYGGADLVTLDADLSQARAIVTKAKTYTDRNTWDAGTLAIANKYFGTTSTQMQVLMRQSVNNVLSSLDGMPSAEGLIYPTTADLAAIKDPPSANCIAYVRPTSAAPTQIFLCPLFWKQLQTGPDSQAMVLVHEVSHLPAGAGTRDYAYGKDGCNALIFFGTPAGQSLQALVPATIVPAISSLTKEAPPGPYTPSSPMENADSFKYFVYDVANRIIPAAQK